MTIIHLEDHPISRAALADMLGVDDNNQVAGQEYLSTEIVPVAEARLRQGPVSALVLDLRLDPAWSTKEMARVLRRLIVDQQPLVAEDMQSFHAYRLALLAHARNVPVALLTNVADYLNPSAGVTSEGLRQAFHADAVFSKEDLTRCAAWVKQKL